MSKFKPESGCDHIVNHIKTKAALEDNLFKVTKLLSPNAKKMTTHFVSFKVVTTNKTAYDKILEEELWGPNIKAIQFDIEHNSKKWKEMTAVRTNAVTKASTSTDTKTVKSSKAKHTAAKKILVKQPTVAVEPTDSKDIGDCKSNGSAIQNQQQ